MESKIDQIRSRWVPEDGFPIGHPIYKDVLRADMLYLLNTIEDQQKDIEFFVKRGAINKEITRELCNLNDPRVARILSKVREA